MYKTGVSTMNEQTKELAMKYANKMGNSVLHNAEHLEEFAELIVRECINIGDNYQEILGNEPECANCRKVAYGIVDKIKKHYGITE